MNVAVLGSVSFGWALGSLLVGFFILAIVGRQLFRDLREEKQGRLQAGPPRGLENDRGSSLVEEAQQERVVENGEKEGTSDE